MASEEHKILEKIDRARGYYQKADYQNAIKLYNEIAQILHDDPINYPVIQIELAWSYYKHHQFSEAIEALQIALKSQQLNQQQEFDCYRIIGFSYEMIGRVKEAIQYLEKAIRINVAESIKRFTYFELGKLLFTDGQIIEAEHYFNYADPLFTAKEKEYRTSLNYYMGFVDYFQKRLPESREKFNYVVQNASDHKTKAGGYFGLAHFYFHQKDYTTLLELCEKIMRLDNTFFDKETIGYFMCESYLNLKSWEELQIFYDEFQKNYPDGRYKSEYQKFNYAIKHRRLTSTKRKS